MFIFLTLVKQSVKIFFFSFHYANLSKTGNMATDQIRPVSKLNLKLFLSKKIKLTKLILSTF